MSETLERVTVAASEESQKLQRHFGRFDILFFLICTIVGVDTIASVASSGGEAFTWMIVLAVIFFIPQALLFAELGSAFPQEGGPYFWTRLAFGHLVGAINNFLYWITNPVWIGGTLAGACVGAIEGSDRALAVSCYDGAGPRFLGVISAKYGTPGRVNIFSGIVATIVVILAETITSGNAAKYFGAVLGVTISTTLISYLGIYPAVWKLRRSHPNVPRPYRMPWVPVLTVLLTLLILIATIQLIMPGLGDQWFGSNYAPDGWDYSEKWIYLLTELVPVLCFALIGTLFWWLGRGTRAETTVMAADLLPEPIEG